MSSGVERIAEAFARADADGRAAAFMPYMMGGYPSVAGSLEIGRALVDGGADLIELGVPFSDPLADGPVIHAADTAALESGARVGDVLGLCRELSASVPVIVMAYVNPILARGVERFCDELVAAGASGMIVPDAPLEEAASLSAACAERGLGWVPLVAPNTPPERMAAVGATARGFLYVVGVTGTTGERSSSVDGTRADLLARARAGCDCPVALGFGISTPEQAAVAAADGADGVIVGSRLVRAAGEGPGEVGELTAAFAAALASD